ncbi:MAG: NAD(P)/FAD-dependent oxidoreductase, partial [Beijerinckiaceae bacterium]
MKIAVIGAGIIGVQVAHALADEGHAVTIIDREGAAAGTSQGNAGWIAHTDIMPLASPKIMRQVPKFLMDPLGPLAIRPGYFFQALPWLARFLLAARPSAYKASMEGMIALQSLVLPAWEARAKALGLTQHLHRRGGLFVFDDTALFERQKPTFQRQQGMGIDLHLLEQHELRQVEPALTDRFKHAVFIPGAVHVSDPKIITLALYEAALARGIGFHRAEVADIDAAGAPTVRFAGGGEMMADAVVLTAGVWSKPLAARLGDTIPLESERGYNVSFPGVTHILSRPVA